MRNPLNQKDYDDILSSIQFHQLTCTCGHSACLSVHGYYLRGLKTPDGIIRLRICRLRCHECRRTHALLPSLIVPYSQVSAPDQADIIHFFRINTHSAPFWTAFPALMRTTSNISCAPICAAGNSVFFPAAFPSVL